MAMSFVWFIWVCCYFTKFNTPLKFMKLMKHSDRISIIKVK
jgi:hypothetical protein